MAVRTNQAKAFVDVMLDELGGPRASKLLMRLDQAVPWAKIVRPILRLPEYRPAWSPAIMLKSLLLAKWFKLSDPALEDALQDRISFRRFVGLAFNDKTPDETSFVIFRNRLREANLDEALFDAVVGHIEEQGLLVKEGTMVDATIVEQSTGSAREDGTSTRDEDAMFMKKHGPNAAGASASTASPLNNRREATSAVYVHPR